MTLFGSAFLILIIFGINYEIKAQKQRKEWDKWVAYIDLCEKELMEVDRQLRSIREDLISLMNENTSKSKNNS